LLVRGNAFVSHPTFSPDGKYLAYIGSTDDGFHLFIAKVHLGKGAHIDTPQMVNRVGTIDSDSGLAWGH